MILCCLLFVLFLITFGYIIIYCIINKSEDLTLSKEEQFNILKDTVAVVGNGPISEEDRSNINKANCVLRFNDLKNYRKGERFDVHATRHMNGFWSGMHLFHHAPYVLPIAMTSSAVKKSKRLAGRKKLPTILVYENNKKVELSPTSKIFKHSACGDECRHSTADWGPSSGAAVIDMLENLETVKKIEVYGMNWNGNKNHIDFKDPYIISKYCSKCKLHPTSNNSY